MNLAFDEQGLYLQLWLLFRLGNASIFIPWQDIEAENSSFFFVRSIRLKLRKSDRTLHIEKNGNTSINFSALLPK